MAMALNVTAFSDIVLRGRAEEPPVLAMELRSALIANKSAGAAASPRSWRQAALSKGTEVSRAAPNDSQILPLSAESRISSHFIRTNWRRERDSEGPAIPRMCNLQIFLDAQHATNAQNADLKYVRSTRVFNRHTSKSSICREYK